MRERRHVGWRVAGAYSTVLAAAAILVVPSGGSAFGENPSESLANMEQRIVAAVEKARRSVVRITWRNENRGEESASGVILTADGYVVTYAYDASRGQNAAGPHVRQGQTISVHLPDGPRVPGVVVGTSANSWGLNFDVIKITEGGVWEHADIGRADQLRPGDACLALGYPSGPISRCFDQEPSVQIGHLIPTGILGRLKSSCRIEGYGERGGGLFDLEGRLVGIHYGRIYREPIAWHFDVRVVDENWREVIRQKALEATASRVPVTARPAATPASVAPRLNNDPDLEKATVKALETTVYFGRVGRVGGGLGGVIITPDGYVATCGHMDLAPGTEARVFLSDGREAPAKILGSDPVSEIGLAKITAPGPWPWVPRGSTKDVKINDPCVVTGYPAHLQKAGRVQLVLRVGWITYTQAAPWEIEHSCFTWGGDCGGGVFDRQGRLIGVNLGTTAQGIDWFGALWDSLVNCPPTRDPVLFEASTAGAALRKAIEGVPPIAVEVLGDGKRRALGTIVSPNGHVLTKASELYGAVSCRVADGRVLAAREQNVSREHDLALLKIEATGLPQVPWSKRGDVPLGTLLGAQRFREPPAVGVVAHAVRSVAPATGYLGIDKVKDAQGGVEVIRVRGQWSLLERESPIQEGDVIVHVEGRPTPNMKAWEQFQELRTQGVGRIVPFVTAGDPIRIGVRRGGKDLEVRCPLLSTGWDARDKTSARNCGFPAVFDIDAVLAVDTCGGPILDRNGEVVGIAIAVPTKGKEYAHVIPAAVARKFLDQLRQ